jgi:hypothetical protein
MCVADGRSAESDPFAQPAGRVGHHVHRTGPGAEHAPADQQIKPSTMATPIRLSFCSTWPVRKICKAANGSASGIRPMNSTPTGCRSASGVLFRLPGPVRGAEEQQQNAQLAEAAQDDVAPGPELAGKVVQLFRRAMRIGPCGCSQAGSLIGHLHSGNPDRRLAARFRVELGAACGASGRLEVLGDLGIEGPAQTVMIADFALHQFVRQDADGGNLVGQAFSQMPQPVQASECTSGMNMACLEICRGCVSSVIALPLSGHSRWQISQRKPL